MLRENIQSHYEQFSGRTLEQYFQTKMMETGEYTHIGNWWDRKGGNEIDVIALNEFTKRGVIAEIKRNERKISMLALEEKISALPSAQFGKYTFERIGLSLKDL